MSGKDVEGAPRLIEWTGERCVPWIDDPPVIYEHFHRYLFAAALVEGRRVLDLASGEGFGAALLAERAQSVLGIDIDEATIAHARANYSTPGLDFQVGNAQALDELEAGAFDTVVAFEMLEHVGEQDRVLAGIRHVLAPDGILIVSTPERVAYSEQREFENPFHVHELTLPEFRELLAGHFEHVHAWGQRTVTGSVLSRLGPASAPRTGQDFVIERRDDRWEVGAEMAPMYLIAVASSAPLPAIADLSLLADPEQRLAAVAREAQARAEQLMHEAQAHAADMREQLLRTGDELVDERRRAVELEARVADAERIIAQTQDRLAAAEQFRAGVESSQVWRRFQQARRRVYGALGGRDSVPGRLVERSVRMLTRGGR